MDQMTALEKMGEIMYEADEVRNWLKDGLESWNEDACLGYAAKTITERRCFNHG